MCAPQSLTSADSKRTETSNKDKTDELSPRALEKQQQEFYRKSAEDHREFLLETLKQVKEQLQQPSALLEATDTSADSKAVT